MILHVAIICVLPRARVISRTQYSLKYLLIGKENFFQYQLCFSANCASGLLPKDYYANIPNISATKSFTGSHSKSNVAKRIMLFKLFIVLYSFVVLASAKECKPGQNCEFKCCSIPEGDLLCRKRCLGLSCEVDTHCGVDCCVNSTCSSCLLKRLVYV